MTSLAPLLFDTYYHIYNRGTNGENIFVEEHNYAYFLALYAKNLEPVTDLFAYCLLKNHFHILVRVKSEVEMLPLHKPPNNLIDAMAAPRQSTAPIAEPAASSSIHLGALPLQANANSGM